MGKNINAKIQVLSKIAFSDKLSKILICCANDTYIHRYFFIAADSLNFFLLKGPQELGLGIG